MDELEKLRRENLTLMKERTALREVFSEVQQGIKGIREDVNALARSNAEIRAICEGKK